MSETEEIERVDISEPITEICRRFGIKPMHVRQIVFEPMVAYVETYDLDEKGLIRVVDGKPVVNERMIQVAT